jgi:hypothetical protein
MAETFTNNDGTFSAMTYLAIGDPYIDPASRNVKVHESKGKRQFLTNNPKKGQTASNWGEGPRVFLRVSEGDKYRAPGRREMDDRLEGRRKFRTDFGFTYTHPMRKSSCTGDYYGAFEQNVPHFSDGTHGVRGKKDKIEELLHKRNILTTPGKKGSYGVPGTKMGGIAMETEYVYNGIYDDYDTAFRVKHKWRMEHYKAIGDRKPFNSMSHALDHFDTHEHVCASKVLGWDEKCQFKPAQPSDAMTPKERVETLADGVIREGFKPFVPSHPGKIGDGRQCTLAPFTSYTPEPFDEHTARKNQISMRNHPVKEAMEWAKKDGVMSEALIERRAFRPNSFLKSQLTKGTVRNGLNLHTIDSIPTAWG